jgi:diguanylate cyclase (GGDEF)-like protein/PAS domain S-box-containing protein
MTRQQIARHQTADPLRLVDQLLNDASLGLSAIDTEFKFSLVNVAFAQILGREVNELIGQSCFDVVHPEDLRAMADSAAQLEQADHGIIPIPTPFRGRHADGHYVSMEVWLQSVDHTGSPYHMVFAHRSAEPIAAIDRYVEATLNGAGLDVSFAALADSMESTFPCDVLVYWGWDGRKFKHVIGNDRNLIEHQLLENSDVDLSTDPGAPVSTALYEAITTGQLAEHISFLTYPDGVRERAYERQAFACQALPMIYQGDRACIVMWNRQRMPVATDHRRSGIGARLVLERTARLGTLALQRWSTDVRLARELRTDPLTQVMNRLGFMEQLNESWDQNETALLLLIDVDRFKSVNDQYGHLAGDGVLRELAQRFRGVVSNRDVVARLGGDEFAILIRANTRAEDQLGSETRLASLIASLHKVARHPIIVGGHTIKSAVSIGASVTSDGAGPMDAMGTADRAMYSEKQHHRVLLAEHQLL